MVLIAERKTITIRDMEQQWGGLQADQVDARVLPAIDIVSGRKLVYWRTNTHTHTMPWYVWCAIRGTLVHKLYIY